VRLQQVFWNILRNAVKFTPQGGHITIHAGTYNGLARVQISDTGKGIEPQVLPRIFHAFEQGHPNILRRYGGLGLGLAISKAIVDSHEGAIQAASQGHGKGASFTVTLPLKAHASAAARHATPATDAGPHAAPRTAPVRILLVEDHDATRQAMSKLLGGLGYAVQTAGTAAEAIALAAKHPVDLVLSDLGLPDRTGYELMDVLRRQYHLTGIALSGFGMEQDQARSLESGFAMHLTKPVTIQALQQAIEHLAAKLGANPASS
jgi:CheY-like chemotaxis protein